MRVESGVHPAAPHITKVFLNGHQLDHVMWFDTGTYEAAVCTTNAAGQLDVGPDGEFATHTVRGVITFNMDPTKLHLLKWNAPCPLS